ncbi:transposase [Natronococcus pandeyae]|uniref:Transposase n=1 Tax=Natronococcus pandeyae TaxID=2055836 RepID=A0A8J8Q242_9EURY|nr:RNA-guided endonuclease TnpB family protein [Natronococcus pandeyae]TYL38026.1 transposase [Natronococcus pandeyae]
MVEEAFQYAAEPEDTITAESAWKAIQTCRKVYNHALSQEYQSAPEYDKPSYTAMQNKLPEWKRKWPEWGDVYSKCLQMAVRRIKHSETILDKLKQRGFDVGELKWKSPREYRSITYNQSGFDVDSNTGRTNHATVDFSKIGTFHLNFHRPLPDDATVKEIILKKQKTGDWTVSIMVEYDADHPDKPAVEDIEVEDTVGIDLGITKFIHDSGGRAFKPLDEEADRERIDKRHQAVSRKEHESNNWNKARQRLARAYERLSNKRKAYREALANAYTKRYDAVFLEDLNVGSMMRQNGNSRNIAAMSWYVALQTFQRFGEKNGCHVVLVPPEGTTKQCVQCGVESEKPLWVREHSCPSCGFETDRDMNAALEVQRRGLLELGVVEDSDDIGRELAESTPVETGTAAGDTSFEVVSASTVVDTGSPTFKERAAVAASE